MSKYTKETSAAILKEEPLCNQSNGAELFTGIGGNFSSISEIVCEMVDDPIANLLRNHGRPGVSNEIVVCFEDNGTHVGIMIKDGGTGIRNLHNALTIAGRAAPDGPLNSHGFGLKHALASCSANGEDWWIETRTEENLQDNTFCRVKGPFCTGTDKEADPSMTIQHCMGHGHVGDHTGTAVYTSCDMSVFKTARPNKKYAGVTFSSLVAYIIEHLRFIYAEILDSGKVIIKVISVDESGNETVEHLEPLLPKWEDGALQECSGLQWNLWKGEVTDDSDDDKVTVSFRYGQIRPSTENTFYFKANQASSGVQVSFNGRVITNRLYSAVYGEDVHPSQNRFLAQIDLQTDNLAALPPTKNTKTSFSEGDPRYATLLKLISTYIPAPEKDTEKLESKLMRRLEEQERADISAVRVTREELAFRSAGIKTFIDLYIARDDGEVIIYEGKAHVSTAKDVAQLLVYILGCIYDGKSANQAVLIAERHSNEVKLLVPVLNEMLTALGIASKIALDTWNNHGIALPA